MTTQQISTLISMRNLGAGYLKIANVLGVPKDTVKKYCQYHGIRCTDDSIKKPLCPCCGIELVSIPGKKSKRFCSDRCRYIWHNANRKKEVCNASV